MSGLDVAAIERKRRVTIAGIISGGGDVVENPPGSGNLYVVAIRGVPVDPPVGPIQPGMILQAYDAGGGAIHYRPQYPSHILSQPVDPPLIPIAPGMVPQAFDSGGGVVHYRPQYPSYVLDIPVQPPDTYSSGQIFQISGTGSGIHYRPISRADSNLGAPVKLLEFFGGSLWPAGDWKGPSSAPVISSFAENSDFWVAPCDGVLKNFVWSSGGGLDTDIDPLRIELYSRSANPLLNAFSTTGFIMDWPPSGFSVTGHYVYRTEDVLTELAVARGEGFTWQNVLALNYIPAYMDLTALFIPDQP